ncbi:MAG: hypothetical protein ABJB12_22710, partial [Pseudomonadota bacterium]
MALIFRIVLGIHIIAGAAALLVFWIPLVTKKGGRAHRRAGWAYVSAAAIVALTGIASAVRFIVFDPRPRAWRAGVFLVYVGLFAAESALLGARVLRPWTRASSVQSAVALVPSLLLIAGGVALGAFGVWQSRLLFVLFAALGVGQGALHARSWLTQRKSREDRLLAHLSAMGTSCITTLTAFVVVNAPRLGLRRFDPRLWFVPIVVLGLGLTIARRHYAKRFAQRGAPPKPIDRAIR